MSAVWLLDAVRTPVGTRDGALAARQAWELGAALLDALLARNHLAPERVERCLLGNALYGGGNPARLACLQAGLPLSLPAITVDSQCCAGLDAVALGSQAIAAGAADIVVAGGLESWSRAPQRRSKPLHGEGEVYRRPPFSPWPERDPDMAAAAATLAAERGIAREQQEAYARDSHARALAAPVHEGVVALEGCGRDEYTRALRPALCRRLPPLAGHPPHQLTAATIASEADGAALLLLCSERALATLQPRRLPIALRASHSGGACPSQPALAPVAVARELLRRECVAPGALYATHIMEAFAVQAMVFIEELGLSPEQCNPAGGALSRGHPIGASGAIELVEAFAHLQRAPAGSVSLCAIAAAGGLGSACLLERV